MTYKIAFLNFNVIGFHKMSSVLVNVQVCVVMVAHCPVKITDDLSFPQQFTSRFKHIYWMAQRDYWADNSFKQHLRLLLLLCHYCH